MTKNNISNYFGFMRRKILFIVKIFLAGFTVFFAVWLNLMAAGAQENSDIVAQNEICVKNKTGKDYIFAVQIGDGERLVELLPDGQKLCVIGAGNIGEISDNNNKGVVSVYEALDDIEGCSRLVKIGTIEKLFKFVDADRCLWSSNR